MWQDRRSSTTYRRPTTFSPWAAIGVGVIVVIVALLITGCEWLAVGHPLASTEDAAIFGGPENSAETYTITYDANGADGGSVPADQTKTEGKDLTLATNTGGLYKANHRLAGWTDGSGTDYAAGASYTDDADVTLYANWEVVDLEKILAADGSAYDRFGYSVAISGDYAIVGAYGEDSASNAAGCVYIFHRTGTDIWDAGTKINASDAATDDFFGGSVAISGDYAIVGAFGNDDNGNESGSAYIFHRTGTNTWDVGTKITAPDAAADDRFGVRVSISGDYAIVGAYWDDDNGTDSGSAYVFHRTGTNTWDSGTKIIASDGAADDYFGGSVGIAGDYAIVGANRDDDNETDSGSAYIFHRTDTNTWDSGTKIIAADGAADDYFGGSVGIAGDYAIVGAYQDDDNGTDSGSAYFFHRTGTNSWDDHIKTIAPNGATGDYFGRSVAIAGDRAIVGAFYDDDMGTDSGSVYVFRRIETGAWTGGTKITPTDGAPGDELGVSVAISGDYAIVGTERDNDNGTESGSAYIFITP